MRVAIVGAGGVGGILAGLLARSGVEVSVVARGAHGAAARAPVGVLRSDPAAAEATASMQRDLGAGRPSELDDQTGAVVRLARDAGVPVPLHETLHALLTPQEAAARGRIPTFQRT